MSKRAYPNGSGSVVAIFGHPLHPMVVPLPIASLLGVLLSDLAFVGSHDTFWSRLSFLLLVAALVSGALAACLGLLEAVSVRRARATGAVWMAGEPTERSLSAVTARSWSIAPTISGFRKNRKIPARCHRKRSRTTTGKTSSIA